MEKFNFKNNIGQENKLLQIEIYKFTNFCKLQNYTSVNIFGSIIFVVGKSPMDIMELIFV
ncbi:Uncharacterised protein [Streptococcus pneumoniae]|nr:Uncharacterised protein [Streptococcus pneumoniae]